MTTRLGDYLDTIASEYRYAIYRKFKGAIRDGILKAIPLNIQVTIPRAKTPLTVFDHMILDQAAWKIWTEEVSTKPKKKRVIAHSLDSLQNLSEDELAKLASEYQEALLKQKHKPAKKIKKSKAEKTEK